MNNMMQDLAFSLPGVDEAMNFAEVMKQVNSMEYSCIVFDTAPTGHTLRFLQFPTVLSKALEKISGLSGRFGPLLNQMSGMMGIGQGMNFDEVLLLCTDQLFAEAKFFLLDFPKTRKYERNRDKGQ